MIKSHLSNQKGFTLLEILIAITILSVGLLALAEMTVYVIRSNAVGNKVTDATVMAQDKLEKLRNLAYSDTQLSNGGDNNDVSTDIHSNTALFTSPDHTDTCDSSCSVTISKTPQRVWNVADDMAFNTPASGMKTVTVIVGWKDPIYHFVALSTIIRQ
jgi:type IV pilus assembly protein PilV